MKTLTLVLALSVVTLVNAQTTLIPDTLFENVLQSLGYDSGPWDGQVLTANIDTITSFTMSFGNVYDLTGIEDFTALEHLQIDHLRLDSLDLTQNLNLKYLDCWGWNQITNLDLTQNTQLTYLKCSNNFMSSLDLTQNILLDTFIFKRADYLTSIDFSQNTNLKYLILQDALITSIDLSQNINLVYLTLGANSLLNCVNVKNGNNANLLLYVIASPNAVCVQIDDISSTPLGFIQSWMFWSENCPSPCSFVGLDELNTDEFLMYPNPAIDELRFSTELDIKHIEILDLSGRSVMDIPKETFGSINVSDLSVGVYFLKLTTEEGLINRKFIKQ